QLPPAGAAVNRLNPDLGPDARAIGELANAVHLHPTIAVGVVPVQDGARIEPVDKKVQEAIIVVVSPASQAKRPGITGNATEGYPTERSIAVVVVNRIRTRIIDHQQVQEAVVVIITPRASCG